MSRSQRTKGTVKQAVPSVQERTVIRDNSQLSLEEQRELYEERRKKDRLMRNHVDFARPFWRDLNAALQHEGRDLNRLDIVQVARELQHHLNEVIRNAQAAA